MTLDSRVKFNNLKVSRAPLPAKVFTVDRRMSSEVDP